MRNEFNNHAPRLILEVEVTNKEGKTTYKKKFPAKSWLGVFIKLLMGMFAGRYGSTTGGGAVSINDEGGTARSMMWHDATGVASYNTGFSALGDSADVLQGIQVGSLDTANDINTYKLATKILSGSTATKLLYGAMTVEAVTNPSGLDLQFRMIRAFTNNSGNTITVKEIGLAVELFYAAGVGTDFVLARDVLASPVDVPDGATLTVRYIAKITVA